MGDKVKDFILNEEYVYISSVTVDNDRDRGNFFAPDLVQKVIADQDNIKNPIQNQKIVSEEQIYNLNNKCH